MSFTIIKKISLSYNSTIKKSLAILEKFNSQILFVYKRGKILGILTMSDIRKGLLKNKTINSKISDIVNKNYINLNYPITEKKINTLLSKENIMNIFPPVIPVIKKNKVIKLLNLENLTFNKFAITNKKKLFC